MFSTSASVISTGTGDSLQPLEHIQATASTRAPHAIGGVGDVLQFFEDEARHDQRAGDEAGLADVGDAPVDDRAGIYQNALAWLALAAPAKALAHLPSLNLVAVFLLLISFFPCGASRIASGEGHREEASEILLAQHSRRDAEISEEQRRERRQPRSQVPELQLRERNRQQSGDDQPDDQSDRGGDQVADFCGANLLSYPAGGLDDDERNKCKHDSADSERDQRERQSW